jgi:hypothetical protein
LTTEGPQPSTSSSDQDKPATPTKETAAKPKEKTDTPSKKTPVKKVVSESSSGSSDDTSSEDEEVYYFVFSVLQKCVIIFKFVFTVLLSVIETPTISV